MFFLGRRLFEIGVFVVEEVGGCFVFLDLGVGLCAWFEEVVVVSFVAGGGDFAEEAAGFFAPVFVIGAWGEGEGVAGYEPGEAAGADVVGDAVDEDGDAFGFVEVVFGGGVVELGDDIAAAAVDDVARAFALVEKGAGLVFADEGDFLGVVDDLGYWGGVGVGGAAVA